MPVYTAVLPNLRAPFEGANSSLEPRSFAPPGLPHLAFQVTVDTHNQCLALTWAWSAEAASLVQRGQVRLRSAPEGAMQFDPHPFSTVEPQQGAMPATGEIISPQLPAGIQSWVRIEVDLYPVHEEDLRGLEQRLRETAAFAHSPHDVCLDFVQVGKQLWANEDFLVAASPYFKDLLNSAFTEGAPTLSDLSSEPAEALSYTFAESDAETDSAELVKERKASRSKPLAPFKRVAITETSYTTFFAVLVWLQTRHVSFAPLVSSFRTADKTPGDARASRTAAVTSLAASQDPHLPAPASPKSIYRLADLLSLPSLRSLALAHLVSQLTPSTAAHELFSDVATAYPDVRDAVLGYVVERWAEVKGSEAMRETEEKAEAGELPEGAVMTALLLAKKLAEAVKA